MAGSNLFSIFDLLAAFFDIACQDAARQDFICSNKGLFDSNSVQTLCLPSIEVGMVSRFIFSQLPNDLLHAQFKSCARALARDLRVTNFATSSCDSTVQYRGRVDWSVSFQELPKI